MATPETAQRVDGTSPVLRNTSVVQPRNGETATSTKVAATDTESTHPVVTSKSHLQKGGDQLDAGVPLLTGSNPPLADSDGELEVEEEEDVLGTGTEGDEVGKLLRTTVSELEVALQVQCSIYSLEPRLPFFTRKESLGSRLSAVLLLSLTPASLSHMQQLLMLNNLK